MKRIAQLLLTWVCLCLPCTVWADGTDDSKYLAGAVPEVNGKVVFTREFSVPGMSGEEIFGRAKAWLDARLKKNGNTSRIVLTEEANKRVVGTGDEWIVFSSTVLALDRTRITYQLLVNCEAEKCALEVSKVRFIYRDGEEKYAAEEWIVDKYALNKDKTKLVKGLAKWRRKTVDFVDELSDELAQALGSTPAPVVETPKREGNVVVVKTPVAPVPAPQVVEAKPAPTAPTAYREVAPTELSSDLIQTGAGKLVIVIGEEPFNMTMMTANAGGSLGKVSGKPVVFTILSPEQSYEQLEKADNYTVRFYPNGEKEPSVVLECKKMPAPAALEGMPRTYVGEIVKASVKP